MQAIMQEIHEHERRFLQPLRIQSLWRQIQRRSVEEPVQDPGPQTAPPTGGMPNAMGCFAKLRLTVLRRTLRTLVERRWVVLTRADASTHERSTGDKWWEARCQDHVNWSGTSPALDLVGLTEKGALWVEEQGLVEEAHRVALKRVQRTRARENRERLARKFRAILRRPRR
jgi:hypothetical protein